MTGITKPPHDKNTTRIYAMIDPSAKVPFYVGSTYHELRDRLKIHLADSKSGKQHYSAKEARIRLICELGLRPVMKLLEICPTECRLERERHWMQQLTNQGYKLTNTNTIRPPSIATVRYIDALIIDGKVTGVFSNDAQSLATKIRAIYPHADVEVINIQIDDASEIERLLSIAGIVSSE